MPIRFASISLILYGIGVAGLQAAGGLRVSDAILLLALPVVVALALLRPEWTVLLVVLLPPVTFVPARALTVLLVVTLFGFLLQGRITLGLQTGIWPLIGIVALAVVFKASTSAAAQTAAATMLDSLVYYTLLVLAAFHALCSGKLKIDTFINVFLVGLVLSAVTQPFFLASTGLQGAIDAPFRGQFAYLSVMGFGVSYVRFALSRSLGRPRSSVDLILTMAFLFLTVIGFSRAAWMAALVIFALVSLWAGRKAFWIVCCLLLALALTVPVVGEQLITGRSANVNNTDTVTEITTGRNLLWQDLWARGVAALPFGNGWGYMWSLTSTDIFGVENLYVTEGNSFIFAHNDFLFLFVELGFLGVGLLVLFWIQLIRRIRYLSRSGSEWTRYRVRVLLPVIVVMLAVELFDNGFAIHFVAERFFTAAGLVFGMYYVEQSGQRSAYHRSRSLDTNQDIAALEE